MPTETTKRIDRLCGALDRRWRLVAIIAGLLAVLSGLGALRLGFDPSPMVYFHPESPERIALAEVEARHAPPRHAVFVVEAEDGSVFAAGPLTAVADLTRRVEARDDIADVRSLATLSLPGGRLADAEKIDADRAAGVEQAVNQDPSPTIGILSGDRGVIAIVAALEPATDAETFATVRELKALDDAITEAHPGVRIGLTGDAALDAAFPEAILSDLLTLVPVQVVLIVVLLRIALQSIWPTLALLAVLGAATAFTMGLAGWSGHTLNGATAAVPTVLLGLAVATSVHIILAFQQALRDGLGKDAALRQALEVNAAPVTLATVTTIVSFLCLNFSDSPPFRQFGNLVAIGLAATLVLAFTLLPVLLKRLPASQARRREGAEAWMAGLGCGVIRWRWLLIALFVLVTAGAGYGVTRITFDDRFANYFDERFEFRRATDLYEDRVSGIMRIRFSVPAADGEALSDHGYLRDLADFETWTVRQVGVTDVSSLLDITRAAHGRLPGVSEDGVPNTDAIGAQILALAAMSDDGRASLDRLADADRSHGLVTVSLRGVSSSEVLDFAGDAEARLAEFATSRAAPAVGTPILAAHLSDRNTKAMIIGTAVALTAISLILVFALRSLRFGVVSLVPNLLPLVIAYGAWGFLFGEVSFAATMVSAMTLGIVIDDAVHFLSKYLRARRVRGLAPREAVVSSFRTVGVAIVVTTVSIATGFLVLTFSGFLVNHQLGLLTAITLGAALLADLLFLPPLILLLDRRRKDS